MSTISSKTKKPANVNAEALAKQREDANRKTAQKPAISESSVKLASLFNDRYGKNSADATNQDSAVLVTASMIALFDEAGISVLPNTASLIAVLESQNVPFFVRLGTVKTRSLLQYHGTEDALIALLPKRESAQRSARQMFPFTVETMTRSVFRYNEDVNPVNRVDYVEMRDQTRAESRERKENGNPAVLRGSVSVNGILFPLIVRSAISVFPARFDEDGKYIPARERKDKDGNPVESSTTADRDVFTVTIAYAESGIVHFSDYGIKNLFRKINAQQANPARELSEAERESAFTFVPAIAEDEDEDAEDEDAENSES